MSTFTGKLAEPVYVEDAYGRPTPVPVLVNEHTVWDDEFIAVADDLDVPVSGSSSVYSPRDALYVGTFFAAYYNRVYVIPPRLSLIDPIIGSPNPFYFWNANFGSATLANITASADLGLTLDFDVGLVISDVKLSLVNVTVGLDAPTEEDAFYHFDFGGAGITPFEVSLLRTNLLSVAPERPVTQTYRWKTNVLTARDGTEQRVALLQFQRVELNYKIIFQDEEEQKTIYTQFFAKGASSFSAPVWHEPMKVSADAVAGSTVLLIDPTRYDVQDGDQIFLVHEDDSFEIVRINTVIAGVVNLFSALTADFNTTDRFYRVTTVLLPDKPTLRRGRVNNLSTELSLRVTETRDLFIGDAVAVEVGINTTIRDRTLSSTVYTLAGVPILNPRPFTKDDIAETFDWSYEVIDYETGAFEQVSTKDNAAVNYDRMFYVKAYYQEFFMNYCLTWMHGQRRPVWMPTWQHEVSERIGEIGGDTITITDERYADDYAADSSHRGLWIKHTGGWLARQVTDAFKDGLGNTIVKIAPNLPIDFPLDGPYDVGFLVLARLGGDEVQIDRYPRYSFFNLNLTSTKSTSTDA